MIRPCPVRARGFTLVEVLVALVIVGGFQALAVPRRSPPPLDGAALARSWGVGEDIVEAVCVAADASYSAKVELVDETKALVKDYEQQYQDGLITQQEKYNKVIDAWSRCGDQVANAMMDEIKASQIGRAHV